MSRKNELQRTLETPTWLENEDAFQKHFDLPYNHFCTLMTMLSKDQVAKYERTRKVNVEAAILWAIHEGKLYGIVKEVPDEPAIHEVSV